LVDLKAKEVVEPYKDIPESRGVEVGQVLALTNQGLGIR
jgi:hypothetical protein